LRHLGLMGSMLSSTLQLLVISACCYGVSFISAFQFAYRYAGGLISPPRLKNRNNSFGPTDAFVENNLSGIGEETFNDYELTFLPDLFDSTMKQLEFFLEPWISYAYDASSNISLEDRCSNCLAVSLNLHLLADRSLSCYHDDLDFVVI
ncbi:hypothetical protein HAX54_025825, partial [Datura stramonium]|nr:hypothetical protein [Datura stramonium]